MTKKDGDWALLGQGWRFLLIALVLLAAGEFVLRGPVRGLHSTDFNDFLSPYVQTKAWVRGVDPYSTKNFLLLWPPDQVRFDFLAKESAAGTLVARRGVPSPYPPTTFMLLAPISFLRWQFAQVVWMGANLAAFVILMCALLSLGEFRWREPRTLFFLAFGLALAPFHTALATQNPTVIALSLSVCALWAAHRDRDVIAGIMLALAICLKPQVGLCLLLYYFVRQRWTTDWVTLALTALLVLVSILHLVAGGTPWLRTYLENSRQIFAPGAINDFTPANPVWSNMLNLQVVLYTLSGSRSLANWLALLSGGSMVCAWLWFVLAREEWGSGMLPLGTLGVLSLLPIYHRFYDATLLVLPLCWCLAGSYPARRIASWFGLLLIAPFLFPGGSLLERLQDSGHIPASMARTWWWNSVVMPHEVWSLLLLSLVLLNQMRSQRAKEAASRPEPI